MVRILSFSDVVIAKNSSLLACMFHFLYVGFSHTHMVLFSFQVLAVNILGRFLLNNDKNIRYGNTCRYSVYFLCTTSSWISVQTGICLWRIEPLLLFCCVLSWAQLLPRSMYYPMENSRKSQERPLDPLQEKHLLISRLFIPIFTSSWCQIVTIFKVGCKVPEQFFHFHKENIQDR